MLDYTTVTYGFNDGSEQTILVPASCTAEFLRNHTIIEYFGRRCIGLTAVGPGMATELDVHAALKSIIMLDIRLAAKNIIHSDHYINLGMYAPSFDTLESLPAGNLRWPLLTITAILIQMIFSESSGIFCQAKHFRHMDKIERMYTELADKILAMQMEGADPSDVMHIIASRTLEIETAIEEYVANIPAIYGSH